MVGHRWINSPGPAASRTMHRCDCRCCITGRNHRNVINMRAAGTGTLIPWLPCLREPRTCIIKE